MNQSELGKTEEEIQHPSSAGLSESGTDAIPDANTEVDADDAVSALEEPAVEDDSAATPQDESAASDLSDEPSSESEPVVEANGLKRGMLVKGVIARTTPTAIFVTLENGSEAIVPGRELELMNKKTLDDLKPGVEALVYIVNPRNHQGKTIVSINYALEEQDWQEAEEYRQSKGVYDGKIGGYNKGGLIVRFGRLRGFVPQSQIAEERLREMEGDTPEERYGKMVNQNVSVKVMEVDRSRNRLILSERAAMREVRQRRKESLITELQVGEVREGEVVSLENFGAFVDIGGAEGLVHLTEITWRHITHPRQALQKGQTVRVRVISVDPDSNRIGLSIKQIAPDPWDEIAAEFANGTLVRGTVTKLTKFGAFARVDSGSEPIEGLIHISELADDRVEHPREVVNKGDVLTLRVVKVDVRERRLGLSLKKVHSPEYLDQDMERAYLEAERDDTFVPGATTGYAASAPDVVDDEIDMDIASEDYVAAADDVVDHEIADDVDMDIASEDYAAEDDLIADAEVDAANTPLVDQDEDATAGDDVTTDETVVDATPDEDPTE